jgi:hypothetical protein
MDKNDIIIPCSICLIDRMRFSMALSFPVRPTKLLLFNQDTLEKPCLVDQDENAKNCGLSIDLGKRILLFHAPNCLTDGLGVSMTLSVPVWQIKLTYLIKIARNTLLCSQGCQCKSIGDYRWIWSKRTLLFHASLCPMDRLGCQHGPQWPCLANQVALIQSRYP